MKRGELVFGAFAFAFLVGVASPVAQQITSAGSAASSNLSNVVMSGDCTNANAAITCTKVNGKTVALGANFTTTGAGAPTLAFSGTGRTYTYPDAAVTLLSTGGATLQGNPGNPTGVASATATMMGLGSTCAITPLYSTRVFFEFKGSMANNTTNDGVQGAAKFGTGTAPANAAAASGTTVGSLVTASAAVGGQFAPFTVGGVITGLVPGTAYWLDIALNNLTGGTASILNINCSAFEM